MNKIMACLHPIRIKVDNSQGVHYKEVPCGKCVECMKRYQNSWYVRFIEQCKEMPKCIFFTLTYRDDSVPRSFNYVTGQTANSVCKVDVQRWLKRARRSYFYSNKYNLKFKYFITSEYGPRTFRPHYHGLIWNVSVHDFKTYFLDDWNRVFGFTTFRVLPSNVETSADSQRALRYVAKYCNKGEMENSLVFDGVVFPTFRLASKGIGSSYISRMYFYHIPALQDYKKKLQVIANRLNYRLGNFIYSLPRYYYDKFIPAKSALKMALQKFLQTSFDCFCSQQLESVSQVQQLSLAASVSYLEVTQRVVNTSKASLTAERYLQFLSKSQI